MQNLSCDNELYFNSFAFSLALKQRLGATRKAKGRTIRKVMGGVGGGGGDFSSRRNFFSLPNSLFDFFRPSHEYFLGLIGVHEFFVI